MAIIHMAGNDHMCEECGRDRQYAHDDVPLGVVRYDSARRRWYCSSCWGEIPAHQPPAEAGPPRLPVRQL